MLVQLMSLLGSKTTRFLTYPFIFFLVWWAILQILPEKTTLANYLFVLLDSYVYVAGAVVAIWYALAKGKGAVSVISRALMFIGLSLLMWSIGAWIWSFYTLVLKVDIPYPSIADVIFLFFVPLLMVGFREILTLYRPLITRRVILESLGAFVVSGIIIFAVITQPDLSGELPLAERALNLAYPLSDVLSLTAAYIGIRVGGGRLQNNLTIFALGMIFQAVGDMIFSLRSAQELVWNGDISALFFMISGYILSLGVVQTIATTTSPKEAPVVSPTV